MQAALAKSIKLIANNAQKNKKFPKEVIPYLLKAVENADPKTRNEIENHIVKMGEISIPVLINAIQTTTGSTRALVAMTLIRLGNVSVEPLKLAYENTNLQWIVDYITNEIHGTQKYLNTVFKYNEVLAG